MKYDQSYYEQENYVGYLDRGDRYHKLAKELIRLLETIGFSQGPFLDYGCAVGFLLEGLQELGYEASGYDVSSWALDQCTKKNLNVLSFEDVLSNHFDVSFLLDVLEHMTEREINLLLSNLDTNAVVFRIPVSQHVGQDYVLECSRNDPTHIIRWTKQQWISLFEQHQFYILPLNLNTIYDSPGVFCGIAIRNFLK